MCDTKDIATTNNNIGFKPKSALLRLVKAYDGAFGECHVFYIAKPRFSAISRFM
jgi:hypothetical protein